MLLWALNSFQFPEGPQIFLLAARFGVCVPTIWNIFSLLIFSSQTSGLMPLSRREILVLSKAGSRTILCTTVPWTFPHDIQHCASWGGSLLAGSTENWASVNLWNLSLLSQVLKSGISSPYPSFVLVLREHPLPP